MLLSRRTSSMKPIVVRKTLPSGVKNTVVGMAVTPYWATGSRLCEYPVG